MKKRLLLFSFLLCIIAQLHAQSGVIKGKVTDKSNSSPLQGVTVSIKGTTTATQTDNNGNFSLTKSGEGRVTLVLSYVGFAPISVEVSGLNAGDISMESLNANLSDVVVVGYGTVKKKDLTGSVVSVKGEEIKKVPAGNVMEALQGKLPGVDVVRTSGGSGASSSVTVRGNRSILANNGPLYIVDGIQYSSYQDINPNDIQSMEVLKDAASTAIYGSRGANGVIIITTKKGASGKAKVTAGAYYGVSEVAGYPEPMNGPEYVEFKRQAARTSGTWNSPADDSKVFSATDLPLIASGSSFYWPGAVIGNGSQQDYNVGISAGTEKTRVFMSYGYFREDGLLSNDYSKRHSVRLNIDHSISSALKVGLQSQLTYYDQNLRNDGILNHSNKLIPIYTPYDANGNLVRFPGGANQSNPLYNELPGALVNENDITRILSTAFVEWKIAKGFSFRSNVGITNSSSRNGYFVDATTIERSTATGSLSRITNTTSMDVLWENILNWNQDFGKHKIGATALTSYLSNKSDNSISSATGQLLPGQSFYALQNNPANVSISSSYTGSDLMSGAFRVNYAYDGKYLLTITGRADGSSIFTEGNKWAFFPSVAAAWRISDEAFMSTQRVFSDLKLRASYGYAGNSAVRPYSTQSGLVLVPFAWNDVQALSYALSTQTGNKDLGWEITKTANLAVDFGLWNQRVTGSIDLYDSKTEDLLLERALPATSGVQKVIQNIGKTRNRGIEIGVQGNIFNKTNGFNWTAGVTYTRNKEEIVDLVGGQDDVANGWFIGHPVKTFYDYQKLGIWQTADSAAARGYGYKVGDIRVADRDGDKKLTANDRAKLGYEVPKYIIGFNNDFKYKGFDLNVYVFARQGQMFISQYANKFMSTAIENGAKANFWTPENPTNDYPRPNLSTSTVPFSSTLGYKDGSYVKIRNITLGYTLPVSVSSKLRMSHIRFYVSARNYFTFSKVKDYDPEGEGSFERPLTKLIITGVNVDF
ncbi:MAG TPA: TonB-dependent receptor [Phnomibacter sp.]|nr:TonB-dependent receptor [Phnomibacter sp.]